MKKIIFGLLLVLVLGSACFGATSVKSAVYYEWRDVAFNGTSESSTIITDNVSNVRLYTDEGTFTAEARWLFNNSTVYLTEALTTDGTAVPVKSDKLKIRLYTASYMTVEAGAVLR